MINLGSARFAFEGRGVGERFGFGFEAIFAPADAIACDGVIPKGDFTNIQPGTRIAVGCTCAIGARAGRMLYLLTDAAPAAEDGAIGEFLFAFTAEHDGHLEKMIENVIHGCVIIIAHRNTIYKVKERRGGRKK